GAGCVGREYREQIRPKFAFRPSVGLQVMLHPCERLERAVAIGGEDETVAQARTALVGGLAVAAQPERNLPPRSRIDTAPVDPVKPPLEGDDGVLPEFAQKADLLFEAFRAGPELLPEGLIFEVVPADADAEAKSLARQQIDVGSLLSDQHGLPLRQDQHARNE